jgi:hypothetical protein
MRDTIIGGKMWPGSIVAAGDTTQRITAMDDIRAITTGTRGMGKSSQYL